MELSAADATVPPLLIVSANVVVTSCCRRGASPRALLYPRKQVHSLTHLLKVSRDDIGVQCAQRGGCWAGIACSRSSGSHARVQRAPSATLYSVELARRLTCVSRNSRAGAASSTGERSNGLPTKTAVVTGAKSGLGFALCGTLGRANYHVVLLLRDQGEDTVRLLRQTNPEISVEYIVVDLADAKEVDRAIGNLKAGSPGRPPLAVLVNSAACYPIDHEHALCRSGQSLPFEGTRLQTCASAAYLVRVGNPPH
eukprot:scaffold7382_cov406-Prasinococcus_capsulatus_cf.AAC.27